MMLGISGRGYSLQGIIQAVLLGKVFHNALLLGDTPAGGVQLDVDTVILLQVCFQEFVGRVSLGFNLHFIA